MGLTTERFQDVRLASLAIGFPETSMMVEKECKIPYKPAGTCENRSRIGNGGGGRDRTADLRLVPES